MVMKMRLIDADALKESIGECPEDWGLVPEELQAVKDWRFAMQMIDAAPTICVPQDTLLRCRTCSFFVSIDCVTGGCSMFGVACTADDYCSKGEWMRNAVD